MPSNQVLKGIGSSAPAEKVFLGCYNGTGAQLDMGSAVVWDVVASDGKTVALPATAYLHLPAGILTETVGTAEYSGNLQAYGPVDALAWGVASVNTPGALLMITDGDPYVSFGTVAGSADPAVNKASFIALETNASVATTTQKIFVKTLG